MANDPWSHVLSTCTITEDGARTDEEDKRLSGWGKWVDRSRFDCIRKGRARLRQDTPRIRTDGVECVIHFVCGRLQVAFLTVNTPICVRGFAKLKTKRGGASLFNNLFNLYLGRQRSAQCRIGADIKRCMERVTSDCRCPFDRKHRLSKRRKCSSKP
jgi:hypothetical protein